MYILQYLKKKKRNTAINIIKKNIELLYYLIY